MATFAGQSLYASYVVHRSVIDDAGGEQAFNALIAARLTGYFKMRPDPIDVRIAQNSVFLVNCQGADASVVKLTGRFKDHPPEWPITRYTLEGYRHTGVGAQTQPPSERGARLYTEVAAMIGSWLEFSATVGAAELAAFDASHSFKYANHSPLMAHFTVPRVAMVLAGGAGALHELFAGRLASFLCAQGLDFKVAGGESMIAAVSEAMPEKVIVTIAQSCHADFMATPLLFYSLETLDHALLFTMQPSEPSLPVEHGNRLAALHHQIADLIADWPEVNGMDSCGTDWLRSA